MAATLRVLRLFGSVLAGSALAGSALAGAPIAAMAADPVANPEAPAQAKSVAKPQPMLPPGTTELTDAMLAAAAAQPRPPLLATSAFAALPMLTGPKLSPSGAQFAAMSSRDGKDILMVRQLDGAGKTRGYLVPDKMDVARYFWAGENRLLISLAKTVNWDGDDARMTRLLVIDLITDKAWILGNPKDMGLRGDDVLWTDPDGKSLLLAYQPTIYEYPAVYSVDLTTRKRTPIVHAMSPIWDWYADASGTVRYGYGWSDEHHWQMVYRKDAASKFAVVARGTDKDDDANNDALDRTFALQAGSDEGFRYGRSQQTGLWGVYRYNFAKHAYGDLVFEAAEADVDSAYLTADGKALNVAYFTDSRDRVKWFDPAMAEMQAAFDRSVTAKLGEREVWIASRNQDDSLMIVQILGSNDAGRYYVFQAATGKMTVLAALKPNLSPTDLTASHYVRYTARDGTVIPAYLTLPAGRPAKGLPLVVVPHGGPYNVRDHGDFDPDV